MRSNDQTPTGLRLEGPYENDRNAEGAECFKAAIREAYGVQDVICAHHLVYVKEDKRQDGFVYQIVEEIPSADALLFDHDVIRKLFGDAWRDVLTRLALEPVETRDALFASLYNGRPNHARSMAETV
jgi:hypothetical protein